MSRPPGGWTDRRRAATHRSACKDRSRTCTTGRTPRITIKPLDELRRRVVASGCCPYVPAGGFTYGMTNGIASTAEVLRGRLSYMAPGVPGRLNVPSMFGTIAGAGIPPSAALSPGIPSSGDDSNAPPAQSGCRHPNISHPGSSWTKRGRTGTGTPGRPAPAGVAFAETGAPIMATPATAAAAAVLVSVPRTLDAITQLIHRPSPWNNRATLPLATHEVSKAHSRRSAANPRVSLSGWQNAPGTWRLTGGSKFGTSSRRSRGHKPAKRSGVYCDSARALVCFGRPQRTGGQKR